MTVMVQMQLPRFLHSWMHDADDVKITEQFAQGCYGKSFKAKVTGVASVCCVKYLNDFVSQEAERDFWSSLVRVAEVGHINIVPFVGVAHCAGSSVITEYQSKGTLAAACDHRLETKRWPVGLGRVRLSCIFYGIANGLHFLHEVGIVHGNLKPNNVCLGAGHRPVLTDFAYRGALLPREDLENLAKEEIIYLAPEILENRDGFQNARAGADIYAFGMTLYISLLGSNHVVLDDGQAIDDENFTSQQLIHEIIRGKRPQASSNIPQAYWSLITRCWVPNEDERPSASDLLEDLEKASIFDQEKRLHVQRRHVKEYLAYISEVKNSAPGLWENPRSQDVHVGSKQSYNEAVALLSDEIVSAGVSVREVKLSISQHVFKCKRCNVTYRLTKNLNDDTTWDVYMRGMHGHEKGTGKPLVQYLKMCITEGIDRRLSGASLLKFVRDKTKTKLPASTIYYHMAKNPTKDWQAIWRKIPSLVDRLEGAGLHCEKFFLEEGDRSIFESVIFELPGMRLCSSDAFLGLIFVDGCHLNDRLRSTLLSMATITSDHILIPLVAMICPSEDKISYERLFRFVKMRLPQQFTIMSDQSQAMLPAFESVFGVSSGVKRLPCFFHIAKSLNAEARWEMKQVLTCDHKEAYSVMLECFQRGHPALFEKLKGVISQMSYMSDTYHGVFEIIADSAIESLNAAILDLRSREPLELIEGLITFTNTQLDKQIENIGFLEISRGCSNTITARKTKAKGLSCRKTRSKFVVTEKFVTGVMVEYNVQKLNGTLHCQCKGYERLGIPCRHIYAVCDKFPKKEKYLPPIWAVHRASTIATAARESRVSVNFGDLREDKKLVLRSAGRRPGRHRTKRFRTYREYLTKECNMKCSACGKVGHTKRSNKCELRKDKKTKQRRLPTLREKAGSILALKPRAKSVEPISPPFCIDLTSQERDPSGQEDELL